MCCDILFILLYIRDLILARIWLLGLCPFINRVLQVLTFAGQYFKVLTDTRLFCQRISVRTQRTSILTSSSSGALIIQTGRCTRQICWWTVISTNLWKIFSRNSKDLNLDVSLNGRTRWLTGRFRWTRQISWWIYSSHALFDRFTVLIIGAFCSKVWGYPFKSAPLLFASATSCLTALTTSPHRCRCTSRDSLNCGCAMTVTRQCF